MVEKPTVETWKITVRSTGAGSYRVSGDYPPALKIPLPVKYEIPFPPNQEYEAKKQLIEKGDRKAAQEIGSDLFSILFRAQMGRAFEEWRAISKKSNGILRLLLDLDEVLIDEPWEYLFSQPHQFLALNNDFSIVRFVGDGDLAFERSPLDIAKAEMLILLSNPPAGNPNKQLDATSEVQAIRDVFLGARLMQDEQSSLYGLQQKLAENKRGYHILHIIGHSGEGQFLFRSGTLASQSTVATGEDIAVVLKQFRTLRLVVLTSCASSELILPIVRLQGTPAIVAMQYDIYDKSAAAFTRAFYKNLSTGLPLDLAVNAARRDLFTAFDRHKTLWGCPTVSVTSLETLECFFQIDTTAKSAYATIQAHHTPFPHASRVPSGHGSQEPPVEEKIAPNISGIEGVTIKGAHQSPVSALVFVDEKPVLVSAGQDGTIRAWHCDQAKRITDESITEIRGSWTGHKQGVVALTSLRITGSELILSASRDWELRAWDWQQGILRGTRSTAPVAINSMTTNLATGALAFTTFSGKLIYVPDPQKLFALSTQAIHTFGSEVEIGGVSTGVSFSEDGNFLGVASTRRNALLFNCSQHMSQGILEHPLLLKHDEHVYSVEALSHGRFVTGTLSGKLCLWQSDLGEKIQCNKVIQVSKTAIRWLAQLKNNQLLLAVSRASASLWPISDSISPTAVWSWRPDEGEIRSVAASSDRTIIAFGLDTGSVSLFYIHSSGEQPSQ